MSKIKAKEEKESLINKLNHDLMIMFGPVIGGEDLHKVLGYKTGAAFRLALKQGDIALPIFNITKRRGKFALTIDIVNWLVEQRDESKEEYAMKTL